MAAALMFCTRRMQSCILRTYLSKSSVIFGTRCDYKSSLCNWNLNSVKNRHPRRKFSTTKVDKPEFASASAAKKFEHDDRERRIMVVLKKKKGELVQQLSEEDLLDYFSAYGEIEDVIWARAKKADPESGKGYGFVSFTSSASLKEAVALKNHMLGGREVFVYPASARRESERTASTQAATSHGQSESARTAPREAATRGSESVTGVAERAAPRQVQSESTGQSESTRRASAQAVPQQVSPRQSVSAQVVSAWIASAGRASVQTAASKEIPVMTASEQGTALSKEVPQSASSVETTATTEPSATSTAAGAASAQSSSVQLASLQAGPAHRVSTRMSSPRVKTPEDEKRKILVTRRRGCGGQMTLKNVHDYFSAFGKIERVHEVKDCMYVTFENAESVERVMLVPHHIIKDVMVLISLAYSDKQKKQLRLEKSIDVIKAKHNPASMKIAEKEGRKIIFMTPARFRDSINEESLEDYFSSYGEIEELFLMESKGYGFIAFKDLHAAQKVLEHGDHMVDDAEVYVKMSLASHKNRLNIEQEEESEVKMSEDRISAHPTPLASKLHVSNIPDNLSLEMLGEYLKEFGSIQWLSFTNYHNSNTAVTTLRQGVTVAFYEESALENAFVKSVHEINGCKLKVSKANRSFAGRPSDFLSLRVLITNMPENLDELAVKEYLLAQSCRVKSVRFLSPTVCIASLWNLRDVNRLVEVARLTGHVIGGNPVTVRRLHWVKEQDEGLKLDDAIVSEMKN